MIVKILKIKLSTHPEPIEVGMNTEKGKVTDIFLAGDRMWVEYKTPKDGNTITEKL